MERHVDTATGPVVYARGREGGLAAAAAVAVRSPPLVLLLSGPPVVLKPLVGALLNEGWLVWRQAAAAGGGATPTLERLVHRMRWKKSPAEIQVMAASAQLSAAAMRACMAASTPGVRALNRLPVGVSERDRRGGIPKHCRASAHLAGCVSIPRSRSSITCPRASRTASRPEALPCPLKSQQLL